MAAIRSWFQREQRFMSDFSERGGDATIASVAFGLLGVGSLMIGSLTPTAGSRIADLLATLPIALALVVLSLAFRSRPRVRRNSIHFWTLGGPRWVRLDRVLSLDVVPYLAIQGTTWGVSVAYDSPLSFRSQVRRRICSSFSGDRRWPEQMLLDLDRQLRLQCSTYE